jgi:hypothetical protein
MSNEKHTTGIADAARVRGNQASLRTSGVGRRTAKVLDEKTRGKILALSADFPRLFNDPRTPTRDRKRMRDFCSRTSL